jgi:hypothetical protein
LKTFPPPAEVIAPPPKVVVLLEELGEEHSHTLKDWSTLKCYSEPLKDPNTSKY